MKQEQQIEESLLKFKIANQIHVLFEQLPKCGLKDHLSEWFEITAKYQEVKTLQECRTAEEILSTRDDSKYYYEYADIISAMEEYANQFKNHKG